MPATYNGIGTSYCGKSNVFTYTDFCPYCNRYVTLSSYDTRHCFVVLFIPIIPLGKKRILDACPVCTRHKQLPLKKYLQLKDEAYAKADQKWQEHPNDPDAACELLQVFAAYQDMSFFDETVPQILQLFPNNAKLLTTVGSIQLQYGRIEQARDYLQQSLAVKEDDQVRHMLGFVYTRLADPDKAAECFQFIVQKQDRQKAGSLFALVDCYQAHGRHQEALVCLGEMAKLDPGLTQNKNFTKSKKLSEKHLAAGKPIKNKQFPTAQYAKTPLSGKKSWAIAAMVCLGILFVYLSISFFMGRRARVFVVNGLNRPYEVALNDRTCKLPASGYQKIALGEGKIEFKVLDPSLRIAPAVLEVRSSFWTRPFAERLYVINPDAIAMIQWMRMYYHENPNAAPEPQWQLYFGKQLHVFDHIDYPFTEFPEEISMSSNGPESRVQVRLFDKSNVLPDRMPDVIEHFFGMESKIDYLKKIIYYEPENLSHLNQFVAVADPDTCIETLRPGLDHMPPYVEWHRYYQGAMELKISEEALTQEYKSRLDKAPDNADLQYLYGRTLHEDAPAKVWFNKSIQNPNPCAYGYYALGYDAMAMADYQTALSFYEKALNLIPEHPHFCFYYNEMLIAVNRLEEAAEFCRKCVLRRPADYNWMQAQVSVLRQLDLNDGAMEFFNEWCRQNADNFSPEDFEVLRRSDRVDAAYIRDDFAAMEKIIGEPNDLDEKLMLTLHRGAAIPNDLMAQADAFSTTWLLLLYLSESRLGNEENAMLFLREAAKRLEKGDYRERCVGACLNADPEALAGIYDISLEINFKAVALTSLGVRFPEHRQRFFDLARRLNYRKTFPYHFLNSVMDEYSKKGPAEAAPAKQI